MPIKCACICGGQRSTSGVFQGLSTMCGVLRQTDLVFVVVVVVVVVLTKDSLVYVGWSVSSRHLLVPTSPFGSNLSFPVARRTELASL